MDIIIMGGLTALGIFIVLWKCDITKFNGYIIATEVGLFTLLAFLFIGTMTGMMIGLVAGVILSALLYITLKLFGAKRLQRRGKFVSWQEVRKHR